MTRASASGNGFCCQHLFFQSQPHDTKHGGRCKCGNQQVRQEKKAHPIRMIASPLEAFDVQIATLSPLALFCTTAPQISSLSTPSNCSPTINIVCACDGGDEKN
jgi:hypothetical protein